MRFVIFLNLLLFSCCSVIPLHAAESAGKSTNEVSAVQNDSVEDDVYNRMEIFAEVLLLTKRFYVENHSFDELVSDAIDGMLHSLDPHSAFMGPEEYKIMKEETSGNYAGIGVRIGVRGNMLTIIAPIEDTPGFRAGLQSGDRIMAIDGEATAGISMSEAVKMMRGENGTKVVLSILSKGAVEAHDVEIVRDVIKVASVKSSRILEDGIGYVRIIQFTRNTAESLRRDLKELKSAGMRALVLDLRGDPGGLLEQAVGVAGLFLKNGEVVVTTKGRKGVKADEEYKAGEGGVHYPDVPLAVLINGGSASASEIVSGAIQDHGRGVLVGETSYGKGSVQSVIPCRTDGGKSAIRLTTAYYYTPKGRLIHGVGLEPDIKVKIGAEEWRRVQMKRMHDENPAAYSDDEKAAYDDAEDRQLERAVDLLKAVLIYGKRW